MANKIWKTTKIYSALKDKEGDYRDSIKNLLDNANVMEAIEYILTTSGTTPKDFTLHDANHSFRVAEKIWEIIPEITKEKLSEYELGFLLLASYLHDIGMSPDYDKVERHKIYLTTNDRSTLNAQEIQALQKWIDNNDKISVIDITKEKIEDSRLSNYILTYYIRYMHNEWSGDWITTNLSGLYLKDYPSWQADLILLCKSHHYNIDELLKDKFDLKPIGNAFLHLRYLAMCLRISDVLENDPERTPEVILRHRSISPANIIYWEKDKWFTVTRRNNQFYIFSRPERAYIEKAIWETTEIIQNELQLCNSLKNIKPLNTSRVGNISYYEWLLEPILDKDIHAKENTYVYIQGGFKPNTDRILELLGGNQLYGNPIWAYRELLQNAFDAVKEKIAYQIVTENRDPKIFLRQLGDLHTIKISLEKRDEEYWLICKDDGVGMTKQIIEKYFLESGSSRRHELEELERRCEEKGFLYGRTGQFGIGVLSYFMIAEKVVVKTKREQLTGYEDADSLPWRFEISGTHDFGELIKYKHPIRGTQIELKLKNEIVGEIDKWDLTFVDFLHEQFTRIPCIVTYNSPKYKKQLNTGWVHFKKDIVAIVKQNMIERFDLDRQVRNNQPMTFKQKEAREVKRRELIEAIEEATNIVDFLYDEGEIANVGNYRIFIPYFKLVSGNNSFYYLKEDSAKNKLKRLNDGFYWIPNFDKINFSLKGIKIQGNHSFRYIYSIAVPSAYIEVDIDKIDDSTLSVSRHSLKLDNVYRDLLTFINDKLINLVSLNKELFNNIYASINKKFDETLNYESYWTNGFYGTDLFWNKVEFPFIEGYVKGTYQNFRLKTIMPISSFFGYDTLKIKFDFRLLYKLGIAFSRTLLDEKTKTFYYSIAIRYLDKCIEESFLNYMEFPIEFDQVVFFLKENDLILSINSDLFKYYDDRIYSNFEKRILNIDVSELTTRNACFTFLILCISNYRKDKWLGLCEEYSDIMRFAFEQLNVEALYGLTSESFLLIKMGCWETPTENDINFSEIKNIEPYLIKRNESDSIN